jgi:hypothetical protein
MTTKRELHDLVDRLPPTALDDVAVTLRQYTETRREPPYPRTIGILTEAPADLSANADAYLGQGFAL